MSPTKSVKESDNKKKKFDSKTDNSEEPSFEEVEEDENEDSNSGEEEQEGSANKNEVKSSKNKANTKVLQLASTSKLPTNANKVSKITNTGKTQSNRVSQIKEDFSPENENTESEQNQNQQNSNSDKQPKYPYDPSNSYPYIHPVPFKQASNKYNNSQTDNAHNIKTMDPQQNRKTFLTNNNKLSNKPKGNFKNGSPQSYVGIKSYQVPNNMNTKGTFTSKGQQNVYPSSLNYNTKVTVNKYHNKGKLRERRSIIDEIASRTSSLEDNKNILLTNPFWDIHTDHNTLQVRSEITKPKGYHKTLSNMINKRWLIPGL